MPDTIIDLIRHGEPVGGRAYRGHNIDDPLSEKGWAQMWQAVGNDCPWHHIVSSPLSRCLAFARALAEDNALSVSVEEDLKEVGFGEWEGKTPDQLKAERLQEYNDFYADPVNLRPPGAEPLEQFFSRVSRVFDRLCEQYQGQHILVVAHAGVIRAIVAYCTQAPAAGMYNINVANAGISRIQVSPQNRKLMFLNGSLTG